MMGIRVLIRASRAACFVWALTSPLQAADITILNTATAGGYAFTNFNGPAAGSNPGARDEHERDLELGHGRRLRHRQQRGLSQLHHESPDLDDGQYPGQLFTRNKKSRRGRGGSGV